MLPIPIRSVAALAAGVALLSSDGGSPFAFAKLADRSRVNSARKSSRQRRRTIVQPDGQPNNVVEKEENLGAAAGATTRRLLKIDEKKISLRDTDNNKHSATGNAGGIRGGAGEQAPFHRRHLSSQLTGCCTNYMSYSASDMCSLYGKDCTSGEQPSHDSGDESCEQEGLSFIGISFSVNTGQGNPYSYQLCDQYPMENIIDRKYDYVMSMDEDGWLVGGGYKSFDYSGKMP